VGGTAHRAAVPCARVARERRGSAARRTAGTDFDGCVFGSRCWLPLARRGDTVRVSRPKGARSGAGLRIRVFTVQRASRAGCRRRDPAIRRWTPSGVAGRRFGAAGGLRCGVGPFSVRGAPWPPRTPPMPVTGVPQTPAVFGGRSGRVSPRMLDIAPSPPPPPPSHPSPVRSSRHRAVRQCHSAHHRPPHPLAPSPPSPAACCGTGCGQRGHVLPLVDEAVAAVAHPAVAHQLAIQQLRHLGACREGRDGGRGVAWAAACVTGGG
jgi:hypothetical protein